MATDKQLKILNNIGIHDTHLTVKEASKLIGDYYKMEAETPATEKQLLQLKKFNIKYEPNITKGEAFNLISNKIEEIKKESLATEKQLLQLKKFNIKYEPNITKGEAFNLISNKIEEIKEGNNISLDKTNNTKTKKTMAEKYEDIRANNPKKNDIEIDIIATKQLLKDGHSKITIRNTIAKLSPEALKLQKPNAYTKNLIDKVMTPEFKKSFNLMER